MNINEITSDHIRSALLGIENTAPDEELERWIFRQSASDDADEGLTFEKRLEIEKDELIDEYVAGHLSPDDRVRFEENFLCGLEDDALRAERHRRLRFAIALNEYFNPAVEGLGRFSPESRSPIRRFFEQLPKISTTPVWSFAQAALVVLAIGGLIWAYSARTEMQGLIDQISAERAEIRKQLVELQGMGESVAEAGAAVTTRLVPGLLRGQGEIERVVVPRGSQLIHMQLDIGIDDYQSYQAALHDAAGDEIWRQMRLQTEEIDGTVVVSVTLPSNLIPRGDYYFRLSGGTPGGALELVGRYHFRVLVE